MKKSLLIIAHGSRRAQANDEVRDLVRSMDVENEEFSEVKEAFLELAEPSIFNAAEDIIKREIYNIVVLPYFLAMGRHVKEDIPNELKKVKDLYPEANIVIAPYLGKSEEIPNLLLNQAKNIT